MLFSVGTKVRLKHTNDLGIIKEVLSDGMLKVRLNDGFEIPVHEHDLQSLVDTIKVPKPAQPVKTIVEEAPRTQYTILKSKGIQLAFEPVKGRDGTTQTFNIYLINDTRYDFSFDIELSFLNSPPTQLADLLSATSFIKIGAMRYDQLNDQPKIDIEGQQLSTAGAGELLHKNLKIKAKTFFSKIVTAPLLNQPSHLFVLFDNFEKEEKKAEDLATYAKRNTKKPKVNPSKAGIFNLGSLHESADFKSELDLHIESMEGNFSKMNNGEILKHQLWVFEKYIDQALRIGVDSVFIIHGLGKGKLKEEVTKRLASHPFVDSYKNEFHPKYGWGATEVIFE